MDVHLLTYDLSRGMARSMSMQFLGIQLDAIYHTSIELGGREYVYDGNIVAIAPGTSHLGRPMERIYLGKTGLPMDVILTYLGTLKDVYTVQAYNLFTHNCNNFSHDVSTFLLGKGIPDHIRTMPDVVLATPMGQMLRPMLEQQVLANRQQNGGGLLGIEGEQANPPSATTKKSSTTPHRNHRHEKLSLPTFQKDTRKPVLYDQLPPMLSVLKKLGSTADKAELKELIRFVTAQSQKIASADNPLPSMTVISGFYVTQLDTLSADELFSIVNLFRCALLDPRFSGYYAEEEDNATICTVLAHVKALSARPYPVRLMTLQMACNLFSTPLYPLQILGHERLRPLIIDLITTGFLDEGNTTIRGAAASLLYNVASANSDRRRQRLLENTAVDDAKFADDDEIELAASVLEAIDREEESPAVLEGMITGLGFLVYLTPLDSDLANFCRAMDARRTVLAKKQLIKNSTLVDEVGNKLLGEGLSEEP